MPSYRTGRVTTVTSERPGLQRIEVDGEPAIVLTQLTGPVAPGDEVVVNTTAVELGLGTGGWHVVHWNLAGEPPRRAEPAPPRRAAGMKLRYTSLQVGVESAESADIADVGGMPVVAAGLHSQLAAVAGGFK